MAALFSQQRCSVAVTLCLIYFFFFRQTCAKTLTVGDTSGWTDFDTSIGSAPNYAAWSSSQSIEIGDILVFTFPAGFHNVHLMSSKAAVDSCDFSQAVELDAGNAGSYAWRATTPGNYFFSCNKVIEGLGTHCNIGQKLAISVTGGVTIPAFAPTSPSATAPSVISTPAPASQGPSVPLAPAFAPTLVPSVSPVGSPALSPTIVPVPPVTAPAPAYVPVSAPLPSSPAPVPVASAPTPAAASPAPTAAPIASPPAPPAVPFTSQAGAPGPSSPPPSPSAGFRLSTQPWAAIICASALLVLRL